MLVTGANRGLGLAFSQALITAGASKVYAAARNPANITLPGVQPIKLDITSPEDVANAAQACPDVTILINNAAIAQNDSFLGELGMESTRSQLETNFFGTLAMCRAFAPILQANGGGALVNVLSVLSWFSMPAVASYCASKSAAWSLTNGVRNELRKQGTLVVGVHAAFIDTDMAKHIQAPKTSPEDVALKTIKAIEDGREEVLIDDLTKKTKSELTAERPIYIREWGAA